MLTLIDILHLPQYKQAVIIRKKDKTSSKTITHGPIYPTKKTIRRKDSNESTFSLEGFSHSEYSPSVDTPQSEKSLRKSSSLNFEKPQSPRIKNAMYTPSCSEYPLVFNPSLISPRKRASTEISQVHEKISGNLQVQSNPQFLEQAAPEIVNQPQFKIPGAPVVLLSSLNLSRDGDSSLTDSVGSSCSSNFAYDNSNDKTVKLYQI